MDVADQALTVLTVPLAASVPAGALEMVLEVFTPNGQTDGHSFFIGSNNLGESAPSYLQAPACGAVARRPPARSASRTCRSSSTRAVTR